MLCAFTIFILQMQVCQNHGGEQAFDPPLFDKVHRVLTYRFKHTESQNLHFSLEATHNTNNGADMLCMDCSLYFWPQGTSIPLNSNWQTNYKQVDVK